MIILAIMLLLGGLLLQMYVLARKDWFFGFVPDGEIVTVEKNGQFVRCIANVKNHYVTKNGLLLLDDPNEQDETKIDLLREVKNNQPWSILGMYWIGIPPFYGVKGLDLRYNKYMKDEKTGGHKFVPKNVTTRSFRFRNPYGLNLIGLETLGRVDENNEDEGAANVFGFVDLELFIVIEAYDLYVSQYHSGGDWLTRVIAAITSIAKGYVGNKRFDELIQEKKTGNQDGLIAAILCQAEAIMRSTGVRVIEVNFLAVAISGSEEQKKRLGDAYLTEAVKRAEGKGVVAEAQFRADAIRIVAKDENDALERRMEILGNSPGVALAEAIRQTPVTTLVLGDAVTPTLPIGQQQDARPRQAAHREQPRDQERRGDRGNRRNRD